MKKTSLFICIALLGLMAHGSAPAGSDRINWLTYEQALNPTGDPSRKFLLYFQTERCRYCRKLEQETLAEAQVAAYINNNYTPVRIDTDRLPRAAAHHGVRGVPDLHFLSPEGEKIANWPGFIDAAQLLPLLQYIHTDSYLEMSYQDFLQQR